MTQPVNVDSAALKKEAANFERIAESLKDQVARVQRTASELVAEHNWKGSARDAVNSALNRYVEAAQAMSNGLNDNSTKLATAGLLYESTDEQQSSRLARAMGFGDESNDRHHGHADTADNRHHDGDVRLVDYQSGPAVAVDPRNPFVGDERFGHWQDVTPPPYVGSTPPAPWTGHKSMEGFPGKGPAGPSGFYVPGGKTWADDSAAPMMYGTEQYRFRVSGEDYTGYTRMVGGQQQQWVQYTYDAQRYTQVNMGNAQAWAPKGPNEVTGELGGVATGGLGGLQPPPKIDAWKPMSLPQIASLSGANPAATYYIPDGCGGQFTFSGGVPVGGMAPPPTVPSMIAGP